MNERIMRMARKRGITRLCHFTPSRNLGHILTDPRGILATKHLKSDDRAVLNPTDLQRLDGHPGHVCCSIQYPNAWYFRKARRDERLFLDWVVLLIKPHYLWTAGTKFCPFNAAGGYGRHLREGADAFDALFADSTTDTQGRTYGRGPGHPSYLPTNEQAEVLVPDRIAKEDLLGFAVADGAQAKRELAALRILDVPPPQIWVAPDFYRPDWLSTVLRSGRYPTETRYTGGEDD
ncbi:MAG TPA: DUF4433 domain-containing protein [Chromatiales bacterium]|nr:DUF4433 domain-containing protein [Chromatiales bacterium]